MLITRSSPIFEYSKGVLEIITVLGTMTVFLATTVGLLQNDVKKL